LDGSISFSNKISGSPLLLVEAVLSEKYKTGYEVFITDLFGDLVGFSKTHTLSLTSIEALTLLYK